MSDQQLPPFGLPNAGNVHGAPVPTQFESYPFSPGNTCYLNAMVQCILRTPGMFQLLQNAGSDPITSWLVRVAKAPARAIVHFQNTMAITNCNEKQKDFVQYLERTFSEGGSLFKQSDAGEFFQLYIYSLIEDTAIRRVFEIDIQKTICKGAGIPISSSHCSAPMLILPIIPETVRQPFKELVKKQADVTVSLHSSFSFKKSYRVAEGQHRGIYL